MRMFKKKKVDEVVLTVTEEEVKPFEEVASRKEAINAMLGSLTDQMREIIEKEQEAWEVIKEKYGLSGSLRLNRETREITKRE